MTDDICRYCEHYKRSFPLFWLRYCEFGEPYFLKISSRFCFSFSPKLEQLKRRIKMEIIKFEIDIYKWVFPVSVNVNLVGNNHRIYNVIISFLCFHLIVCIDEDAR